jgi:hypothetical protein
VGYLPFDAASAALLFQLIASRYATGTVIVTSNLAFSSWAHQITLENDHRAASGHQSLGGSADTTCRDLIDPLLAASPSERIDLAPAAEGELVGRDDSRQLREARSERAR